MQSYPLSLLATPQGQISFETFSTAKAVLSFSVMTLDCPESIETFVAKQASCWYFIAIAITATFFIYCSG